MGCLRFAGATVIIAESQKEIFKAHFESFKTEYRPVGPTEEFLTYSLAEISWAAQQIRAKGQTVLTMIGTLQDHLEDHGDPILNFELAQAANLANNLKEVNLLGIYEQRKMRLFTSTRRELVQIQAERKAREIEELEEAAITRETAPPDWQPSHDGFACSIAQIDRYLLKKSRQNAPAPTQNGAPRL
jgi:deoxyribodipyrimidine photolyase